MFTKSFFFISLYKKKDLTLIKNYVNLKFIFLFVLAICFTGCCPYSFTGASTPEHIRTIAIPLVEDRSGSGEARLRENFTNKLVQKFIDDNTLDVSDRTKANSILQCTITSISDAPVAVTAGERVAARRITINVHVVYKDLVKRKNVFERTFSNYSDYTAGANLAVRGSAIEEALDRLTEDILLETVSGW